MKTESSSSPPRLLPRLTDAASQSESTVLGYDLHNPLCQEGVRGVLYIESRNECTPKTTGHAK
jgi:hypothetical protein